MGNESKSRQKVSESPIRPSAAGRRKRSFDVRDLYAGPAGDGAVDEDKGAAAVPLDDKMRQAYFWIVNNAVITPYYDIEFHGEGARRSYRFGGAGTEVRLPSDQSYSSFVLLPLLTFAARRRCLFIGGPGRGKTVSAVLMGVLAGYPVSEVRRSIQHGQPQMTIADLLGNPLPRDLVEAETMESIRIAWRKWLSMRVKIIDEYNRIPTRTQSALLSLLADGYAEILDQTKQSPPSAWFLTANDDMGGGTYQVIEALKDRIDIVVKALNFNPRFLGDLLERVELQLRPEEVVPEEIVFSEAELDQIHGEVLAVPIPPEVRRRIEFFAAQFDFCDLAARELEYKSKDTIRIAEKTVASVCSNACGRDKVRALCSQTENGLSVRALMTLLSYVKTLAWFRGAQEATLEDVRQIVPWVLHDKLVQNPSSPFFEQPDTEVLRVDRVAWIRHAFDLSCAEYVRLDLDREDPVLEIEKVFDQGLEGVSEREVKKQMDAIESQLSQLAGSTKLLAHVHNDVLKLKYYHQRYSNYLRWLTWNG